MEALNNLIDDLESKIELKDLINTQVSERDVSWHVAHCLKVISKIMEAVQNSNPEEYRWKFNFNRSLVGTLGFIPRGKGKAPKSVLPSEHISIAILQDECYAVRKSIDELQHLDARCHFQHPYFGTLNLKQTKKFLAIHTKHHLKIIDDIISKNARL